MNQPPVIEQPDTPILPNHALPQWFQVFLALFSFLLTLLLSRIFGWKPSELVWGFWASSLCLGFALMLISLAGSFFHPQTEDGSLKGMLFAQYPIVRVLGNLGALLFFTLHFGFFHLIIGIFLQGFFPLITADAFAAGPFAVMPRVLAVSLRMFWMVIALTLLSQSNSLRAAFFTPVNRVMGMPYVNVIRMHLSIFIFAALTAFTPPDALLVVVLLLYYFPWGMLLRFFIQKKPAAQE